MTHEPNAISLCDDSGIPFTKSDAASVLNSEFPSVLTNEPDNSLPDIQFFCLSSLGKHIIWTYGTGKIIDLLNNTLSFGIEGPNAKMLQNTRYLRRHHVIHLSSHCLHQDHNHMTG